MESEECLVRKRSQASRYRGGMPRTRWKSWNYLIGWVFPRAAVRDPDLFKTALTIGRNREGITTAVHRNLSNGGNQGNQK